MHSLILAAGMVLSLPFGEARGPGEGPGRKVPLLTFVNEEGKKVGLADYRHARGVVVVILGRDCPITNAQIPEFLEFQEAHPEIPVIGIHMGPLDTVDQVAKHRKAFSITFPTWLDREQSCFDGLGATRTGEVFFLDERRRVIYQGPISDKVGFRQNRVQARGPGLHEALTQWLAGKPVGSPRVEVAGCLVSRRGKETPGGLTYHRDIAPIVHAKCSPCHHANSSAPFSLLTAKDSLGHAAMVGEVIQERRMPPWFADKRFGNFANDRTLSVEQIETIRRWIEDGCQEGDAKDGPVEPDYSQGWRIGQPDLVMKMPQNFSVPAKGPIPYQFFTTRVPFSGDRWIQKMEIRPGNRAVVHHLIVFWKVPGKKGPPEWLCATIPGGDPTVFPEGMARRLPGGTELLWQVHYNPTGKPEVDRSEIGFVFADQPPRHPVELYGLFNNQFRIPAGAKRYQITSEIHVARDLKLLNFFPHMHARGKEFEYQALYPNGTEETLLSIPDYDSNWQTTYRLKEPKRIPRGTKLRCVAHYDNSAANPANPDPKVAVTWGEQSRDEMMIGYIDYIFADPRSP